MTTNLGYSYKEIQQVAAPYRDIGIDAQFYTPEDTAMIDDVISRAFPLVDSAIAKELPHLGIRVTRVTRNILHTVFPTVTVEPCKCAVRKGDTYGFLRFNGSQFLLRPNLSTVNSCHSFDSDADYPGANLGYLASPFWTCYGIYIEDTAPEYISPEGIAEGFVKGLPDILISINVLFCYNVNGEASAMLSRPYGKTHLDGSADRLIDYLSYVLGLNVYIHRDWSGVTSDLSERAIFKEFDSKRSIHKLYTPPHRPQIIPHVGEFPMLIYRYSDISRPHPQLGEGSEIQICEHHEAYLVRKAPMKGRATSLGVNSVKKFKAFVKDTSPIGADDPNMVGTIWTEPGYVGEEVVSE